MKKVYIRTFGCQMNEYDTTKMFDVLAARYGAEPTDDPLEADVILFNTCSVREKAQEKVFHDLGRVKELKRRNPDLVIGVGGCVASQEGEAIVRRAPYVDVVFGPQTLHRLPELIEAKGVLVFPNIIKAGLVFGGSYGEGVLFVDGKVRGFYNSVSASWGLQLGAQSYGYALFLMNDKALKYLEESQGWELGSGPNVTLVDTGVAANLSTTTLRDDAYAFIFDQQGLMGGINIEGTKITRIEHP